MESDDAVYPDIYNEVYQQIIRDETEFSVLSVERKNNVYYKAIMCLLALNGAKDFRKFESITFSELDDHHIFPKAYLQSEMNTSLPGLSATAARNSIVNRTLISAATNRSIGKKAPSQYLRDEAVIPQDKVDEILGKHFVGEEALQALRSDNYARFMQAREQAIIGKIRSIFKDMPVPPRHDDVD